MLTIKRLGTYQKGHAYLPRNKYDAEVRAAVEKIASRDLPIGQGGFLVVSGPRGVGKTACVANFVDQGSGDDFLRRNCRFSTVIWFDLANLLRNVTPKNRERYLLNKLATSLNINGAPEIITGENEEIDFSTFDEQMNQQSSDRVLLIFDHITCPESIIFLSKIAVYNRFRCLVITTSGDNDQSLFNRYLSKYQSKKKTRILETVKIPELSLAERKQMLKLLLSKKLLTSDDAQINRLAGICGSQPGLLHLIDAILTCYKVPTAFHRISSRLSLVHAEQTPASNNLSNKNDKIAFELVKIIFTSESLLKFARRFFAFLLFPPGEPVDVSDLALLWNCDVDEANEFCQENFVSRNLATEIVNEDGAAKKLFSVHRIVHEATVEFGKNQFGTRAFSFFFGFMLTNAAKKQPERRKGENILHVAVRLARFRLIEAIISSSSSSGINVLRYLSEKSSTPDCQLTPISLLFLNSNNNLEAILSIFEQVASIKTSNWLASRRRTGILTKIHQHISSLGNNFDKHAILLLAVERNYVKMAKFLVEEILPSTNRPKPNDEAMVRAVTNESVEMVSLLLENGADADATSPSNGRPVLMMSILSRNVAMTKVLLDGTANPNAREHIYYDTALIEASRAGLLMMVNLLLVSRAHPDMRNYSGETALMTAAMSRHRSVVETLLFNKADPNARDNRGRTALMRACEKGSLKIVTLLLERGADPNTMGQLPNPFNGAKCTALSLALAHGHITIARVLLENGANSHKDTRLGVEALTAAIRTRNPDAIQLLLDHGVDVNATLPEGKTMLMLACQLGEFSTDFVQTLLEINADPNRVDRQGETALSYCYRKYAANPLSRQNVEKLQLVIRASCPESFRGVWLLPAIENDPSLRAGRIVAGEAATLANLTFFGMITHSVTRLEKLCALRVRQLIGPGYISNKVERLILPDVVKDILLLKQL